MFEAYSDDGRLQVSSTTHGYFMKAKGAIRTFVTWPPASQTGCTYTPFPSSIGIRPDDLIALRCNTGAIATAMLDPATPVAVAAGSDQLIEYWIFRKFSAEPVSASGAGLEIYDENGALAWSTSVGGGKFARVYSVDALGAEVAGMSSFVSLPADRTFAFINTDPSIRKTGDVSSVGPSFNISSNQFEPAPNGRATGVRAAGNGYFVESLPGFGYVQESKTDGKVMVVDVTGY